MISKTSQHGEDDLLVERFKARRSGYFVEVGALDGILFSNTNHLEKDYGWRGVLIEADPRQAEKCRGNRPESQVFPVAAVSPRDAGTKLCLHVAPGNEALSSLRPAAWSMEIVRRATGLTRTDQLERVEVSTATLDSILDRANSPVSFELLSVDVEGFERDVFSGFSLGSRWKPEVILVENGMGILPMLVIYRLLRGGYSYCRTIGHNDWYETRNLSICLFGIVKSLWANRRFAARQHLRSLKGAFNLDWIARDPDRS